ncbi:Efflux pump membrane transporter BepE [Maioricimonas rarisocia]|uniref:Efflux pump membrane transporter BepE n=1 Tax=Maioricimonas rarisocia TaxID=2528026 RepID=A0A517ZDM8_9PLAN|nr:efflux RND transporter permease subunit [Maioricimonas rarisocia]QDU40530.1 Efflux pump membrane transporter BepE [Maioricimonas rarisocia]
MSLPRFSVENPVLVNMMMAVVLLAGAAFAFTLVREMFPESRPNKIAIMAVYPAVQPQELEKAITIKVEEAVRDVDGVEKVDSSVSEGLSTTTLTLFNDVDDVDTVLQEVKNEVDALQDLPDDLEKITVFKIEPTLPVIMVAVYGDGSEADLKQATRDIRDDLLELPGVSDVLMTGLRDDEISVEIRPDRLLEYNVTFDEVAAAIRQTNLDVSGGNLKGDRGHISVRTLGEEQEGADLEDIEIRSLPDGRTIRLRDVAIVRDDFVDTDAKSYFNGKRAANLIVEKTATQDAIQISTLIKAYAAGKGGREFHPYGEPPSPGDPWWERSWAVLSSRVAYAIDRIAGRPDPLAIYEQSLRQPFPHRFQLGLHTDLARFVEGRLDLMLRNGKAGLLLVLMCLMLFLNWRVALWTAIGLPVSFLGTFIVMWLFGVSMNLLSMFGLIIVLGIIVDDAIVIGENIYRRVEEGMPAREAAIKGAEEVMWPVLIAVTTTIAAFSPLLFIQGQIGDFMSQLPLVVIAALTVSLAEALIILPAHLRHLPSKLSRKSKEEASGPLHRLAKYEGFVLRSFLLPLYEWCLRLALRWRYVSLAVAVGTCMMALGLFFGRTSTGVSAGNVVGWEFIQKLDAESMQGIIEMPVGTSAEEVRERLEVLSDAALAMPEVTSVQVDVAQKLVIGEAGATGREVQSHFGQLFVELLAADEREAKDLRSSDDVLADLRRVSEKLTGVNSITWEIQNGGPGGKDIEIRFTGDELDQLQAIAEEYKAELATYNGVVDLDDDLDEGKREIQISLREAARPTGVTVGTLGNYVRAATYGAEARRITRNREDVKIMVRYPEDFREDVYNIESMWIPTGGDDGTSRKWIPMWEVAALNETRGYTTIHRSQQQRSITVFGEIDSQVTRASDVVGKVRREFTPEIQKRYPGVKISFLGSSEEQGKAFGSLKLATPVALMMIYMLLAGLFRSYLQPLVVMAAIPFGIQGAIIGHWITGYPMTILSAIGMVALTGIVVNDSLVLVDFINNRIRSGMSELEASVDGAKLRLRPILLTTLTTVAGLTPLMFERSFQAKFLIPMAVTLTFGLVFATVLTLGIVPVLNMIFFDVRRLSRQIWGAEPEEESPYSDGGSSATASPAPVVGGAS